MPCSASAAERRRSAAVAAQQGVGREGAAALSPCPLTYMVPGSNVCDPDRIFSAPGLAAALPPVVLVTLVVILLSGFGLGLSLVYPLFYIDLLLGSDLLLQITL